MNYFITGGAGFIGSHVAEELVKSGHRVVVLDDLSGGFVDNLVDGLSSLLEPLIMAVLLRAQSMATYQAHNTGHFGTGVGGVFLLGRWLLRGSGGRRRRCVRGDGHQRAARRQRLA